MIITRTPLRISLAGGGSDLPAFYREEPGCVVSTTINKYIYITASSKYDGAVRASYSITENVARSSEVAHPLIRACLDMVGIRGAIEVVSVADIPAGTGLGSSSAFTVGLLAALYAHDHQFRPADMLAHDACYVEIDRCGAPIGKQDQYAAAHGGLRSYTFHPNGRVSNEAIALHPETRQELHQHLLLLDTGLRRDAGAVLAPQAEAMRDTRQRANVRAMANLAQTMTDALRCGRVAEVGDILDTAWALKRALGASSDQIDAWYTAAKRAGALGGKVCGAGGGGFMLFLAPPEQHRAIVQALGLRRVPIRMVDHGVQVVYAD
jgi:D-glycero-alpha-D-manno-heptose-7-phosphate kinase